MRETTHAEGVLSVAAVSTGSSRSGPLPVARRLRPPKGDPAARRARRLREGRAKARRAKRAVSARGATSGPLLLKRGPRQLSVLERASVQPGVAASHGTSCAEFTTRAAREKSQLGTDEQIDAAAVDYLDSLYFRSHEAASGDRLLAAIKFMRSGGPRPLALPPPRTRGALKGFRNAAPGASRVGLPREWAAVIPGALEAAERKGHRRPRLVARPEERGQPRQTGSFDDAVTVEDLAVHLPPHLAQLAKRRTRFQKAAGLVGLGAGQLCAHQARHGGASRDAMLKRRDLSEIQE
ncbi:unnamed protein product [Prorocentrum cordatum]|uniref:Ribosome biogenesis protein NOP53 n=1 Tax=Prorocentrum cordatum TaxID=2364126 RepID=A0ABN9S0U4_9DINO|nr:unnamed protein product [Polarella glacialis]